MSTGNDIITKISSPDTNRVITEYPNVSNGGAFPLSNNNNNKESFKALKLYRDKTISNKVPATIYEELKDILRKERKNVGDWLVEKISEEIKVHGDGNPAFTLDHFQDPNFIACPAFYRPIQSWESYLSKLDSEEFKKWDLHLNELLRLSSKHNRRKFH